MNLGIGFIDKNRQIGLTRNIGGIYLIKYKLHALKNLAIHKSTVYGIEVKFNFFVFIILVLIKQMNSVLSFLFPNFAKYGNSRISFFRLLSNIDYNFIQNLPFT